MPFLEFLGSNLDPFQCFLTAADDVLSKAELAYNDFSAEGCKNGYEFLRLLMISITRLATSVRYEAHFFGVVYQSLHEEIFNVNHARVVWRSWHCCPSNKMTIDNIIQYDKVH